MNISIVGTGYVGLVSGACFAEMGIDVTCVDIDEKKIGRLLSGEVPIYEPGLDDLVRRNVEAGRLHFTTDLSSCLDQVEVVFSAVGTPPDEDGSADLRYVLEVARTFGRNINKYTILVTKSTVPVGTSKKVKAVIQEELDRRGVQIPFEVASNPEFLKEGAAIKDFMSPDRIVVGTESERAQRLLSRLYRPFLVNNFRIYFMDIPSAEMTKYAANAMLATRISFMNDIANLCDEVGADIDMVYVIAAYHDLGMSGPRAIHHITSGKILQADARLKRWFNKEQIKIMKEAVEDHRASSSRQPRSIYGKIVAEADRDIDVHEIFLRAIQYGKENNPADDKEQQWERFSQHMDEKYSRNGYIRLWIPNSPNEKALNELRNIIEDKTELRKYFEKIFEENS